MFCTMKRTKGTDEAVSPNRVIEKRYEISWQRYSELVTGGDGYKMVKKAVLRIQLITKVYIGTSYYI